MTKRRVLLFLTTWLVISCIDPVDIQSGNKELFVIDGLITNEDGPYGIRIGKSLPFDNTQVQPAYFVPETDATVSIVDGQNNIYPLSEEEPGVYVTPFDFKAEPLETYVLKITTKDNTHIESLPERMPEAVPIDAIQYKYTKYQYLVTSSNGSQVEQDAFGFTVSVKITDPANQRNYYRWKATGIFEFFAVTDVPEIHQCWAPLQRRIESGIQVVEDVNFNGNEYVYDIGIIPYERPTYFLTKLEQYAMTEGAFRFWNELKKQQSNTGSIFDAAPAPILGNMVNTDNPDVLVLGYFGASTILRKDALIQRFNASGRVSPSPNIEPQEGSCLAHEPQATNIKPPGFE